MFITYSKYMFAAQNSLVKFYLILELIFMLNMKPTFMFVERFSYVRQNASLKCNILTECPIIVCNT